MKASKETIELPKPRFEPFKLVLTVETEEEARALFAIFSYIPNCELLNEVSAGRIRKAIGTEYSSGHRDVIANGVTYIQFYSPKVK